MNILNTLIRRKHSSLTLLTLRAMRKMSKPELQDAVRLLCATVLMTDDMALCRILGRYKMFVDRADLGFSSHVMLDGYWQMWATRAILRTVREGMWVADVGANVGYYTLLLADLVGESGHTHAIEPNVRRMQLLQQSVATNDFAGRVSLHRKSPTAPARLPAVRQPTATGRRKVLFSRTPAEKAARVAGPDQRTICLDDIIKDERLDFVKIDGKGVDRDFWYGMRGILARHQALTIMLDFTVDHYRDPDVFLADMVAARFSLARVDASGSIGAVSIEQVLAFSPGASQTLSLSR